MNQSYYVAASWSPSWQHLKDSFKDSNQEKQKTTDQIAYLKILGLSIQSPHGYINSHPMSSTFMQVTVLIRKPVLEGIFVRLTTTGTQTWSIFLCIRTEPSILMPIHMRHISDSQFVLMLLIQRIWPFKKLTLQVAVVSAICIHTF